MLLRMRAPPPSRQRATVAQRHDLRLLRRIDPTDLRDSAAIGYAQALTRLLAAKDRWLRAAQADDTHQTANSQLARARAARVLHAVGAEADRALDELHTAAADVARCNPAD